MPLPAVALLAALFAWPAQTSRVPSYAEIVAQYRAGHFAEAIAAMRRLDRKAIVAGAEELAARRPETGQGRAAVLLEAAVLLHTEVFNETDSGFQLGRAEWLAAKRDARDPASLAFLRAWWLLLASALQGKADLARCEELLGRARARIPDDAEILRASGAVHEMYAQAGWSFGSPVFGVYGPVQGSPKRLDVSRELENAARFLRRAVALAPDLAETRLRYGRVLHVRGELDPAAAELERIVDRPLDDVRLYLARLFLASVEHDRDRRPPAAELYVAALKGWPGAQSSLVGLSALLYADGQPDVSAEVVARLVEQSTSPDPWRAYVRGELWHYEARRDALRAAVREQP
jgi:tetratricopeptide (TPR) repeat protein